MRYVKFLIALALIVSARPAFAQFTTENGASVGYCEGCQSGNVVLVMDGGQAQAFGLKAIGGDIYSGPGQVQYARNGVTVNELNATFRVHMIPSPCGDCLISQFPDVIDAYDAAGNWILSASKIRFDLTSADPKATYASTSVGNLPASLKRLRRPTVTSWGSVKYQRSVTGRLIAR